MSQYYIHANVVEICQLVHEIRCTQALFGLNLAVSPAVTMKIRSRSPKPNQLFLMSQRYIRANLVKILPPVHEISCTQESVTPTPMWSAPKKNNMSSSPSVGDIITLGRISEWSLNTGGLVIGVVLRSVLTVYMKESWRSPQYWF